MFTKSAEKKAIQKEIIPTAITSSIMAANFNVFVYLICIFLYFPEVS
jgi:hypothetical protein